MSDQAHTLIIRWPDGSSEPLTPELSSAIVAIAAVFPNAKAIGCRLQRTAPDAVKPYWMRTRDDSDAPPWER